MASPYLRINYTTIPASLQVWCNKISTFSKANSHFNSLYRPMIIIIDYYKHNYMHIQKKRFFQNKILWILTGKRRMTEIKFQWWAIAHLIKVPEHYVYYIMYFISGSREVQNKSSGWRKLYETVSTEDLEQTTVGYLSIILALAHEFYTLNTVIRRCMIISASYGQQYTVITVDQALYCKLMELK